MFYFVVLKIKTFQMQQERHQATLLLNSLKSFYPITEHIIQDQQKQTDIFLTNLHVYHCLL